MDFVYAVILPALLSGLAVVILLGWLHKRGGA